MGSSKLLLWSLWNLYQQVGFINMHKILWHIARKIRCEEMIIYVFKILFFVEIQWEFNAFWDFIFIIIILCIYLQIWICITSYWLKLEDFCRFTKRYTYTLREKCPYSDFFWSVFSRIRTEYGEGLFSVFSANTAK